MFLRMAVIMYLRTKSGQSLLSLKIPEEYKAEGFILYSIL